MIGFDVGLVGFGVLTDFTVAVFFTEGLATSLAFTALLAVFLAAALLTDLALPRRAVFFAAAARFAPALAFDLTVDFALVALDFRLAAFDVFFRPAPRAFLARAAEGFALERDAVAALDLLDFLLAMVVAAGKGFRRASQSEVMI